MIRVKFNRERFNAVLKSKGMSKGRFVARSHYTRPSWYEAINHRPFFSYAVAEKIAKAAKCKIRDIFEFPEYVRFKSVTTNKKNDSSLILFELGCFTGRSRDQLLNTLLRYTDVVKILRAMKKKYKRVFDVNKTFVNSDFQKRKNGEGVKKKELV